MISVLLAEDQTLVLGALAALLGLEHDIEVVGCAGDGDTAWQQVQTVAPDVLVTDIEMPGMSGLDLARAVQARSLPCRVLIVTTFARPGYLRRALDAGVRGYLLKDAPSEQLAAAIRKVHAGCRIIAPELAAGARGMDDPLTEREREVLRLAADGASGPSIGRKLCLAEGTVRNYLSEAIGKLGAKNRIEAARIAREKGWL